MSVAMGRDLLNALPDWVLIVLITGGSALIGCGAALASHRWLPHWWSTRESADVVMGTCAVVLTLFTVILGFVIVDLYTGYASADANVQAEANSLRLVMQDAQALPMPERQRVEAAVGAYVVEVACREFPDLRTGEEDPQAETRLAQISAALQRYSPVTPEQAAYYDAAVDQVNQLTADRGLRISVADTSVPVPFDVLLVILAVVGVATACLARTTHPVIDVFAVTAISLVIGAGFVTALILQYPFSGSVAFSAQPFVQGALGAITHFTSHTC